MKPPLRRVLVGIVAGTAASWPLAAGAESSMPAVLLGIAIGVAFEFARGRQRRGYAASLLTASAVAMLFWTIQHFALPALAAWVRYGLILGLLAPALCSLADRLLGAEKDAPAPSPPVPKRIVILGGGFAGMTTALRLEKELRREPNVEIALVDDNNAMLFTPMLAEVAGGSLEPSHISAPLRTAVHRTRFIRGRPESVDFERKVVRVGPVAGSANPACELPYDHLVLSLGSVSNYFGAEQIQRHTLDFKTLLDAIRIRNHIIEVFERADRETDPTIRREHVTFVVAGGGFAGVELAGAINDFAHGILPDYPSVAPGEIRTILVHSRDRILPELSESLGRYALDRMAERGVEFRLNTRVLDAAPGRAILSDGEVRAQTVVWTAGTAPNPLIKTFGLATDKRGAALVESTMAVAGRPGVWALGDCAALKDGRTGQPCPPTAQYALREAKTLARNLRAALHGRAPALFHFESLGALCVIGHQTACAELILPIFGRPSLKFSGLLAWIMWRTIYLAKLPGLERKIHVLIDWNLELFFPRDIVQTIDLKERAAP